MNSVLDRAWLQLVVQRTRNCYELCNWLYTYLPGNYRDITVTLICTLYLHICTPITYMYYKCSALEEIKEKIPKHKIFEKTIFFKFPELMTN